MHRVNFSTRPGLAAMTSEKGCWCCCGCLYTNCPWFMIFDCLTASQLCQHLGTLLISWRGNNFLTIVTMATRVDQSWLALTWHLITLQLALAEGNQCNAQPSASGSASAKSNTHYPSTWACPPAPLSLCLSISLVRTDIARRRRQQLCLVILSFSCTRRHSLKRSQDQRQSSRQGRAGHKARQGKAHTCVPLLCLPLSRLCRCLSARQSV